MNELCVWYTARGHKLNFYVGWVTGFCCPPIVSMSGG
jgi:hypothetical protein